MQQFLFFRSIFAVDEILSDYHSDPNDISHVKLNEILDQNKWKNMAKRFDKKKTTKIHRSMHIRAHCVHFTQFVLFVNRFSIHF